MSYPIDKREYRKRRAEGNDIRLSGHYGRAVNQVAAWARAVVDHEYVSDNYTCGALTVYAPSELPEFDEYRRALAALDPDLRRWHIRITVTNDEYHETAEGEVENAGFEIAHFDSDVDEYDPEYFERYGDPRPYGGAWEYAEVPCLRKRYRTERAYLTLDPDHVEKWYGYRFKGESKGRRPMAVREFLRDHLEAFAAYLDRKYDDRRRENPQHVYVEILWDGGTAGEASCGGYDPSPDDEAPVLMAEAMDLIHEAVGEAERWAETVVERGIKTAERAVVAAKAEFDDLLLDALTNEKKYPRAAYRPQPKE